MAFNVNQIKVELCLGVGSVHWCVTEVCAIVSNFSYYLRLIIILHDDYYCCD